MQDGALSMSDVSTHRVLQEDNMLSYWEIVYGHPLVAAWSDIPCSSYYVHGELQGDDTLPQIRMAVKQADAIVPAGDLFNPNLLELLSTAVPSKISNNSDAVLDEQVRKGLELGPELIQFASAHQLAVDLGQELIKHMEKLDELLRMPRASLCSSAS